MKIAVFGLWHLGSVTAACLAEAGFSVVGFDPDENVVGGLTAGRAPLHEPGLDALLGAGLSSGKLSFTTDPEAALAGADVWWVTLDTPVNDDDEADVAFVRKQLDSAVAHARPGTVVLVSSQIPAGFTGALERDWQGKGLRFAVSPENLRLGKALECFRRPERVVVGVRNDADKEVLQRLFAPFCSRVEWMSVESAEMTKHALNAFLATSVTFINELARLCEVVGADAKEVERGLKSESRIGPGAYLSPGAAFAGGTLARDVRFLAECAAQHEIEVPLFLGVRSSNDVHKGWMRSRVDQLLAGIPGPVVAILGLTYKPGTDTLRRSPGVELCSHLLGRGVAVRVHDPRVTRLPADLHARVTWGQDPGEAVEGADVAVLATPWPEYRALRADELVRRMRRPQVIDANHFLAGTLGADPRVVYLATGTMRKAG